MQPLKPPPLVRRRISACQGFAILRHAAGLTRTVTGPPIMISCSPTATLVIPTRDQGGLRVVPGRGRARSTGVQSATFTNANLDYLLNALTFTVTPPTVTCLKGECKARSANSRTFETFSSSGATTITSTTRSNGRAGIVILSFQVATRPHGRRLFCRRHAPSVAQICESRQAKAREFQVLWTTAQANL